VSVLLIPTERASKLPRVFWVMLALAFVLIMPLDILLGSGPGTYLEPTIFYVVLAGLVLLFSWVCWIMFRLYSRTKVRKGV